MTRLWLGVFLVAGLYLSGSAQETEDMCPRLLTALSLDNNTEFLDRWNLIEGYTDHDAYTTLLNLVDSSWMFFVQSPNNSNALLMGEENKINGVCMGLNASILITFEGNTSTMAVGGFTSKLNLLPSCTDCKAVIANNTIKNAGTFFRAMGVNSTYTDEDEISVRTLYLMARGSTVEEPDLETFRQQAKCLGFSQPAAFHYDPKKGFFLTKTLT